MIAILAACSGSGSKSRTGGAATSSTIRIGPTGDAFYQPPSPLPNGSPGSIIWADQVEGPAGIRTYKVLYHSHSALDKDVAVSGMVYVPTGAQPAGGWPILAWAHGTTGLGDQCAPSKDNGKTGGAIDIATVLVPLGFVVAATDYEGLGTPGVHPYVVGQSEGRGVLDSIRAARLLSGDKDGKSIVWGHSQGGGSALFAAELAPTYASDVKLAGAVAGAPVAELKSLETALRTSPFFGYVFMAAAGFKAAYPNFDVKSLLTERGLAAVNTAETSCTEVIDQVRGANAAEYLRADPSSVEPDATLFEENTPGNIPTSVPIFVYQGEQDEQIPVVTSLDLLQRMCRVGGFTVFRKTYPGANHTGVIALAAADIQAWVADRLAGKTPPRTACPAR